MKVLKERKRIRLRDYDYSLPGAYFVTVCTKRRENVLGLVVKGEMRKSAIGEIAAESWRDIPNHHRRVETDEFVVMPNHVHGIVIILDDLTSPPSRGVQLNTPTKGAQLNTPTKGAQLNTPTGDHFSRRSPVSGSLSVIVRNYKAAVTTWCRRNGHPEFAWQRGYYEHLIRNDRSLQKIREYIETNPQRWTIDRENRVRAGADEFDRWMQSFSRPPWEKSG